MYDWLGDVRPDDLSGSDHDVRHCAAAIHCEVVIVVLNKLVNPRKAIVSRYHLREDPARFRYDTIRSLPASLLTTSSSDLDHIGAGRGAKPRPRLQQLAPLVEQVGAPVGALHRVADEMCQT